MEVRNSNEVRHLAQDVPAVGRQEALLERQVLLKSRRGYLLGKRLQDIVCSLAATLLLSPLMLLLSIIIVIDSPGACPIFSQTRVGKDGKTFKCFKFRSMHPNAEERLTDLLKYNEMQGPVFKIKNDPRITRVGRFIRATGIDELPQLINVLLGDMTLVGPRPPLPREVEQYDEYQFQRLLVTPGLTCFWQIQPHRNDMNFDDWVELDLKYIRERSFLLDWKIIFQTFAAVLKMDGQ